MGGVAAVPGQAIHVVAVIGAGRLGRSFALECAAAGYEVILEDVMPANLRRAQDEYEALAMDSAGTLAVAMTVEEAVTGADLAVDFVPDELESKLEIFSLMDRMAPPRTTFLTPTEALSITDLASCVYRPDRCFAVRGGLVSGAYLRLLHPAECSGNALVEAEEFLRGIGRRVEVGPDPDAPMLVKNLGSVMG